MRDLIWRLRLNSDGVLLSSQIMQEVSALCDRIVEIGQRKVAADGTPDDLPSLTGHDNLEDGFVSVSGPERGLTVLVNLLVVQGLVGAKTRGAQ